MTYPCFSIPAPEVVAVIDLRYLYPWLGTGVLWLIADLDTTPAAAAVGGS